MSSADCKEVEIIVKAWSNSGVEFGIVDLEKRESEKCEAGAEKNNKIVHGDMLGRMVAVNDVIFIIGGGGCCGEDPKKTVWSLDLVDQKSCWKQHPCYQSDSARPDCVCYKGKIYVFGGGISTMIDEDRVMVDWTPGEVYDPKRPHEGWKKLPIPQGNDLFHSSVGVPVHFPPVVDTVRNRILVPFPHVGYVYAYYPHQQRWEPLLPMGLFHWVCPPFIYDDMLLFHHPETENVYFDALDLVTLEWLHPSLSPPDKSSLLFDYFTSVLPLNPPGTFCFSFYPDNHCLSFLTFRVDRTDSPKRDPLITVLSVIHIDDFPAPPDAIFSFYPVVGRRARLQAKETRFSTSNKPRQKKKNDNIGNMPTFTVSDPRQTEDPFNAGLLLTESNYETWSQLMEMHIAEREKLSYITSKNKSPAEGDTGYDKWYAENQKVKRWLLMSMSPDIMKRYLRISTARDIWTALSTAFCDGNDEMEVYSLHQKAFTAKQNSKAVSKYYGELTEIFRELDYRDKVVMKDPDDIAMYRQSIERLRAHIFLAGLDKEFDKLRREILRHEPFPSLEECYSSIRREVIRLSTISDDIEKPEASDMLFRNRPNETLYDQSKYSNQQNSSEKPTYKCTHCNQTGHSESRPSILAVAQMKDDDTIPSSSALVNTGGNHEDDRNCSKETCAEPADSSLGV